MDGRLPELVTALETAIASGRPVTDGAIRAWERLNNGRRDGLNAALLELVDQGLIQAVLAADRHSGARRVLKIVAVNRDMRPVERGEADRSVRPMERIEKDRTVFVVHGRDTPLRDGMFQFLRSIDLHPLEWGELTATSGTGTPYIGAILDTAFDRAKAV